jgi:thioredoxin reductase (NADPH)
MYDVVIVGAGSAGLAAGIYAARAGMNAVILETVYPGGQIARANHVENYPGFPDGVDGADLALRFKSQAERLGAVIETAEVTGFELEGDEKTVRTSDKEYKAKAVVLAMGARFKTLGLFSEGRLTGSGVSYCATCDGAFFKAKDVAVVGGGDTAVEDALFLTAFANKIYIVHRRSELRAQKALQEKAFANEKIEFVWDSEVETILGENFVEGIRVKNLKTSAMHEIKLSGVFIAVGTEPQTEGVKSQLKTDTSGYIITDADMKTSLPGVFAAGDIVAKSLRQVVTAAADGAVAINSVKKYILGNL